MDREIDRMILLVLIPEQTYNHGDGNSLHKRFLGGSDESWEKFFSSSVYAGDILLPRRRSSGVGSGCTLFVLYAGLDRHQPLRRKRAGFSHDLLVVVRLRVRLSSSSFPPAS